MIILSGKASFLIQVEGIMIPIHVAMKGAIVGVDHTIQNYA